MSFQRTYTGIKRRESGSSTSSSSSSKKSRRVSVDLNNSTVTLMDALCDETTVEKKVMEGNCSCCRSLRILTAIEEGPNFRLSEIVDIELLVNSVINEESKWEIAKPILLCPTCLRISKKFMEQKSRIALLESRLSSSGDDAISAKHLKQLSELQTMKKALDARITVRIARLKIGGGIINQNGDKGKSRSDYKALCASRDEYKKKMQDLDFRNAKLKSMNEEQKSKIISLTKKLSEDAKKVETTSNLGKKTSSTMTEAGVEEANIATFKILLHERDKELVNLDKSLKSIAKVKDMAISAQNIMKIKNQEMEKKLRILEHMISCRDISSLPREISLLKVELDDMKNSKDLLSEQIMSLTKENNDLKYNKKSIEENRKELVSLQERLLSEKVSLESEIVTKERLFDEKISSIKRERDEAVKEKETISKELKLLKEISSQAKNSHSSLSVEDLRREISEKDKVVKRSQEKIKATQAELASKVKRIINYKMENSKLDKRLKELKMKSEKDSGIGISVPAKNLEIKMVEQNDLINKLNFELNDMRRELDFKDVSQCESLSLLNSEVQELKSNLAERNENIKNLSSSVSSFRGSFEKSQNEIKELKTTLQTLYRLNIENNNCTPNESFTPISNSLISKNTNNAPFTLSNAKQYFGDPFENLSAVHKERAVSLSNKLISLFINSFKNFNVTETAIKSKMAYFFDKKYAEFLKLNVVKEFEETLCYAIFTEAFLHFFKCLPDGKVRRKLQPDDKLIRKLPSMEEAAAIVAKTPILLNILENVPSTIPSVVPTTSSNNAPPPSSKRQYLRVKSDLMASTVTSTSTTSSIQQVQCSNSMSYAPNYYNNYPSTGQNVYMETQPQQLPNQFVVYPQQPPPQVSVPMPMSGNPIYLALPEHLNI